MPTISMFYGIIIRMYCAPKEHSPAHFHAYYQDFSALIDIETCEIIEGTLPRKATETRFSLGWVETRRTKSRLEIGNGKWASISYWTFKIEVILMYIGVKDVKALEDYKLQLTFKNDETKIFDVSPYLDKGIFKTLKDINIFNSVRVAFDSIEWSNGVDMDPETLYEDSL